MRSAILIPMLLLAIVSSAQQTVQYTNYNYNAFGLNPAVAGSKECVDIKAGYRMQWLGFAGAPRSMFASIHGALGKKHSFKRGWHGLGLYVEKDDQGPYSDKGIYPAYAYHLRMARAWVVAFGISVGFKQKVFKGNEVTYQNAADPLLGFPSAPLMYPEISPGIWAYSKRTYIGLSAKQVYKGAMKGPGGTIGSPSRDRMHYYFTFGRVIEDKHYYYTYVPSIHVKYTPLYPPGVDANFMWFIKDRWGMGLSYRFQDAVAAVVQLKFLKFCSLSYAFDFTTSKVRVGSSNTHEIMIGINPCKKGKGDEPTHICPAYN